MLTAIAKQTNETVTRVAASQESSERLFHEGRHAGVWIIRILEGFDECFEVLFNKTVEDAILG